MSEENQRIYANAIPVSTAVMTGKHLSGGTAMKFHGRGQPLTRAGLSKALAILGLGPHDAAYIWTVVEVETAGITQGFGFRIDRRPQILFERHIFCKRTDGCFDGEAPDVSGPAGDRKSTRLNSSH